MLDGQIERALVEVELSQQMIGQHVLRFRREQPLQFVAGFLAAAVALVDQRQQESLVDVGVAQEQAAFRAELVRLGGGTSAARAAN